MTDGLIEAPTRVVLLGLDGFPHAAVRADRTPNLWRLGVEGGRAPDGGVPPLPSTTYPGFASLLTGLLPERHGVRTTAHRPGAVPGWAGRRSVPGPTLLDVALAAGLGTRVVLGDHLLHGVLRVPAAAWPPSGRVPAGTPLDAHGYATNEAVRPHLLAAARDPSLRLLFGHLNEADTLGHEMGPASPEAVACHRGTDAIVGELLDALLPAWDRTLIVVVSDHDMDPRAVAPPIDPGAILGDAIDGWIGDGEAAWLRSAPGVDEASVIRRLEAVDGLAEVRPVGAGRLLALAAPGRVFAGDDHPGGVHGGSGTERTLAIVGGGHPLVPWLAAAIRARRPHLADWAPTVARLFGLALPTEGRDLLEL